MRDATPTDDDTLRESLLDSARALVPLLAARAGETERNRALLPEIHAALTGAGLFRIMMPPYLGGLGLDAATHFEVAAELARGCGSTAWVQCLVGYQNHLVGWYPPAVQDAVRAGAGPLFAGLVMGAPVTADSAAGGLRLTGRWPYVSGVDHANWLMLSARAPEGGGRVLTCLVPREACAVDDDWYAMGMRGTGSKSVLLDGLFVPDSHVLCFREAESGGVPGAAVNGGPLYRGLPTSTLFVFVVAAPALGLAAGAIDAFRNRLATRTNARMPSPQSEWPSSQMRLGRAAARLEAARLSFFEALRAFCDRVASDIPPGAEERVRWRMAVVEAVADCTAIVYELFGDAGTGAAMDGSPLQRAFRDIHVLRSHFVLTPDMAAENAGRVSLGLPPKPPFT